MSTILFRLATSVSIRQKSVLVGRNVEFRYRRRGRSCDILFERGDHAESKDASGALIEIVNCDVEADGIGGINEMLGWESSV
jgi:hypothetical protein